NDPSAGSPTETLLRLVDPLNDQSRCQPSSTAIRSVLTTGGVYKEQGQIQRMLMTYAY
ncbi:hypothetical protein K402DRAFT_339330, partial [Aulographum hederae CBS 113979]